VRGEGDLEVTSEHNYPNVANARTLRRSSTDAERLLWKHLRMRQLGAYKFRRQHPIGTYIVDFVCLEKMLIVELDGGQHTEQMEYDKKRSKWLRECGYRVLRYWNHEVLKTPDVVMAKILEEIERKMISPSPRSSPSLGRG
jgi:very-short-patch-repair endonuclease